MMPYLRAHARAIKNGVTPEEYEERMGLCLREGYVFSTPTDFMAAHDAGHNGEMAYFVLTAVASGDNVLARLMGYFPEPRPWVLWCRNNEQRIRAFRWDKLARKVGLTK